MKMNLETAEKIIDAALREGSRLGLPPLSCAVVDAGGHLVAMKRQDNATFMRGEVARAKAWTCIALGVSTQAVAERYASATHEEGFLGALNSVAGGPVIPLGGGFPLKMDGNLVGAVGVSGAKPEQDAACALAGAAVTEFEIVGKP